jgi:hypothetical protein
VNQVSLSDTIANGMPLYHTSFSTKRLTNYLAVSSASVVTIHVTRFDNLSMISIIVSVPVIIIDSLVIKLFCRRRWLSGTTLASLVLDSTARTPILRNITMGRDITGGFCPGAGFPSCHKSIYRVSEDNFRGSACVSEWILISVKRWGVGLS